MVFCEIRNRELIAYIAFITLFSVLLLGGLNIVYFKNLFISRVFLVLIFLSLLFLFIFLNYFKRKIEIILNSSSINFLFNQSSKSAINRIENMDFNELEFYKISYPNNRICLLKFVSNRKSVKFFLTDKKIFDNQSLIKELTLNIHKNISLFNNDREESKKIIRHYSFFASRAGLYTVVIAVCIIALLVFMIGDIRAILFQLPFLSAFLLLAISQRKKERTDFLETL